MFNFNLQSSSLRGNSIILAFLFSVVAGLCNQVWAAPASLPVVATPYNTALSSTNGNKSVAAPDGTFHMVYVYGGQIKYTATANATNWTLPITISGNATAAKEPTIAVAAYGSSWVIGVTFVDGTSHTPFYTFKAAGSANWSVPVSVNGGYASSEAREPSMVGYGEDMFLTWTDSMFSIRFAQFPGVPANSPIVNNAEQVTDLCLCGISIVVSRPSISVTKSAQNDTTPRVRVGYFSYGKNYLNIPLLGVEVAERPSTASSVWPYHNVEWAVAMNLNQNSFQDFSLSMAANALTGDFYLAYSYLVGTTTSGVTRLAYDNAWNTNYFQKQQTILPRLSQIDVASTVSTTASTRQIRIAVNDFTLGSGGSGPVSYQTGQWFDSIGLVWLSTSVKASNVGRDPQAIFWTKSCQSKDGSISIKGSWREIYALFTAPAGSGLAVYEALDGGSCLTPMDNTNSN